MSPVKPVMLQSYGKLVCVCAYVSQMLEAGIPPPAQLTIRAKVTLNQHLLSRRLLAH